MYLFFALGCQPPTASTTPVDATPPPTSATIAPEDSSVLGAGVKGPFLEGAALTVTAMDGSGELSDRVVYGDTDDRGRFRVPLIAFREFCEVAVTGPTFDELQGSDSTTEWTLRMVAAIEDFRVVGNVNLLTHLLHSRVKRHMVDVPFDEARQLALTELGRLVPISHPPSELDLLNQTSTSLARDNAILLSWSVAVLDAQIEPAEYDLLTEDFADDGRIDGDGLPVWTRMRAGSDGSYALARGHLLDRYGSAPPELPPRGLHTWKLGCRTLDPTRQALCEGFNDDLTPEAPASDWADFDFVAPASGSWVLGAEFGTFHNFHRWSLVDANGTLMGSGNGATNRLGSTLPLDAGELYTFSAYNASDTPTSVTVDIARGSMGTPSDPERIMVGVPEEGWTTLANAAGSRPSYYRFDRSQLLTDSDRLLDVTVNDVSSELRIEAFTAGLEDAPAQVFADTTRRIAQATGSLGVTLDGLDPDEVLLLRVEGLDTGFDPASRVPGRIPYRIQIH